MTVVTLPIAPRTVARFKPAVGGEPETKSTALSPVQAVKYLHHVSANGAGVCAVHLAGPGEPLATLDLTVETLRLIRDEYPDIVLSLSTLGLLAGKDAAKVASQLAKVGLAEAVVQVNAVDAQTAAALYAWVRPGTKTVPLDKAVAELLAEQEQAVSAFAAAGLRVVVEMIVVKGVNENQAQAVADAVRGWGAAKVKTLTPSQLVDRSSGAAGGENLPQGPTLPKFTPERPNVAVATSSGHSVDTHLGHATQLLIYGKREDGLVSLLEARTAPPKGGGDGRWQGLAEVLGDCRVLLAASAGERPRQVLGEQGLEVMVSDGDVEAVVDALYGGGKKPGKKGKGSSGLSC